jgi:hypothetical protein
MRIITSRVADLTSLSVTREEAEQDGAEWFDRGGASTATAGAVPFSDG